MALGAAALLFACLGLASVGSGHSFSVLPVGLGREVELSLGSRREVELSLRLSRGRQLCHLQQHLSMGGQPASAEDPASDLCSSSVRPSVLSRRDVGSLVAGIVPSLMWGIEPGRCTETDLLDRRFEKGKIKNLGPAGPLGVKDAEYPEWLNGKWDCEFTYQGRNLPMGKSFAEFKQLLAGSVRSPGEKEGDKTSVELEWIKGSSGGSIMNWEYNLKNLYNSYSHEVTIETGKGPRSRSVAWMPILTQRGVYEKVNDVKVSGGNQFTLTVKEIAPDLSTVGTCPVEGAVVNRKTAVGDNKFVISELQRIKRLSQGKVKMIETGTGDIEVLTEYVKSGEQVNGRQRVLVYLVPFQGPAGDLYADSQGNAVAVYDWTFTMNPKP